MIDVLANMPNLETLKLDDCLPSLPADATASPSPDRIISLPHLSRISLGSLILECADILGHLSFPPSASIQLNCSCSLPDDGISPLLQELGRIYKKSYAEDIPRTPLPLHYLAAHFQNLQTDFWAKGHWLSLQFWTRSTFEISKDVCSDYSYPILGPINCDPWDLPVGTPQIQINLRWPERPGKVEQVVQCVSFGAPRHYPSQAH